MASDGGVEAGAATAAADPVDGAIPGISADKTSRDIQQAITQHQRIDTKLRKGAEVNPPTRRLAIDDLEDPSTNPGQAESAVDWHSAGAIGDRPILVLVLVLVLLLLLVIATPVPSRRRSCGKGKE